MPPEAAGRSPPVPETPMYVEEIPSMGKLITLPFAALLRWMYSITGSYGVAIILFSLILKLILLPFQMKSKRSMVRMGRLSGKQAELQKQYAKNQQKYQEELAKLYQEEGVNPMSGCLWSFLPLFLLLPLYQIVYRPITHFMGLSEETMGVVREAAIALGFDPSAGNAAYEQVALTEFISREWDSMKNTAEGLVNVDFNFLGIDLSALPTSALSGFRWEWGIIGLLLIPFLAAGIQFLFTFVMNKTNGQAQAQQGSMKVLNLMMPLFSLWWCFSMPAAMGVYWFFNSFFSMIQEGLMGKFYTKKLDEEEAERAAKRDAARQLRMEEAKKRAAEQRELEPKKPKKQPQKPAEKRVSTTEAGRVGERPYARGRSYREDRYDDKE